MDTKKYVSTYIVQDADMKRKVRMLTLAMPVYTSQLIYILTNQLSLKRKARNRKEPAECINQYGKKYMQHL